LKIICTTEYGGNYAKIAGYTTPIFKEYCKLYGYDFRVLVMGGTGNEYAYKKHEYFEELFKEDVDAIFYLDVDAVITDFRYTIESFIDEEHSFFITEHLGELNGGAMIIKNDDAGRWVNEMVLSERNSFDNEQNVLNFYREFAPLKAAMKILPHPSINSFNYELYPECPTIRKREQGHFHEGDFIFHVPALGTEKRLEVLKSIPILK